MEDDDEHVDGCGLLIGVGVSLIFLAACIGMAVRVFCWIAFSSDFR